MTKYKGANQIVNKTLTTDGTTAISLAGLDAIIIYLIHKKTNTLIQKHKYPSATGYDPITIVDSVNGQIRFYLQEDAIKVASRGLLKLEYLIESANTNFDDNLLKEVATEDYDILIDTKIKDE